MSYYNILIFCYAFLRILTERLVSSRPQTTNPNRIPSGLRADSERTPRFAEDERWTPQERLVPVRSFGTVPISYRPRGDDLIALAPFKT